MLFNSIDFAIFLPIVFILYWFVFQHSIKKQNVLLLVASYFFYGYWDWRFLSLLFISSIADYIIGISLGKTDNQSKRKLLLSASLLINLGLLGFFKYFNFFAESFEQAFTIFGHHIQADRLKLILPVGISFYTFQTLSYSIDVYRKKIIPTHDFIGFITFVSFFPQLVAGPIERASHLLPQFQKPRCFDIDLAKDGLRQILWGLFKKMVIADNCAELANQIFANYPSYNGSTLLLGAFLFSIQIYGDFSGYSDIAIGTARLFSFSLMKNFNYPYFSRNIAEFWRRWHISLSTWFRDYVYFPLGGSFGNQFQKIRNVLIIFVLSGFWHGANWTFMVWGFLNALYYLPSLLSKTNRKYAETIAPNRILPNLIELFQMLLTNMLIIFAWIFFRAQSVSDALLYINGILSPTLFYPLDLMNGKMIATLTLVLVFIIIEWIGRNNNFALEKLKYLSFRPYRWSIYYLLIIVLFIFTGKEQQFIYFQF